MFVCVHGLSLVVLSGGYYSFPFFHCNGASRCRTQALEQTRAPQHIGLVAPQHVRSSQTWDQTHIPCFGRQILKPLGYQRSPIHFFFHLKKEKGNKKDVSRAMYPPTSIGEVSSCFFKLLGAPSISWLVAVSLQFLPPSSQISFSVSNLPSVFLL